MFVQSTVRPCAVDVKEWTLNKLPGTWERCLQGACVIKNHEGGARDKTVLF